MIKFEIDPRIPKQKLGILEEIKDIISKIEDKYKVEDNISIILLADSDPQYFRFFLQDLEREEKLPSRHIEKFFVIPNDILPHYGAFIRMENPAPIFAKINSPLVTVFHEYFHSYFYLHQYDIRHCEEFFCEYLSLGYTLKIDDAFDPMEFLVDNKISPDQFKEEYSKILSTLIKNKNSFIKHHISQNSGYLLRYLAVWRFFKENQIEQGDFQTIYEEMCNAIEPYEPKKVAIYQKMKKLLIDSSDITDFNTIEEEMKKILEFREKNGENRI